METSERTKTCAMQSEARFVEEAGNLHETTSEEREYAMAEDIQVKREITVEVDAEAAERMKKEGHARGFTVYCDEGESAGGDNSAPPPLAYFGLSLAF